MAENNLPQSGSVGFEGCAARETAAGRQNKTVAPLSILVVSFLAALITVPPNPLRWYVTAFAIFIVSYLCCRVGERQKQTTSQSPSDLGGCQPTKRFQFSLRTLVAIVSLAAFLFAGIAWSHQLLSQLQERAAFGDKINSLMQADLSNYLPGVQVVSSGGGSGGSFDSAETGWSWQVKPGSRIPDDFLDTMGCKIKGRLRELGAYIHGHGSSGLGGGSTDDGIPVSSSRDFSYQVGDIRGTIVLRLISWGGPNRGGIVFLDHLQAR